MGEFVNEKSKLTTEDVVNYVIQSPQNTNPNVLRGIVNTLIDDSQPAPPSGTINITSNGTDIDVAQYAKAYVSVPSVEYGTWTLTMHGGTFKGYVLAEENGAIVGKEITSSGTYLAPKTGFAPVYLVADSSYKFNASSPSGINANVPFNKSFPGTGVTRVLGVTAGDAIDGWLVED